jgi:hypothetical protein
MHGRGRCGTEGADFILPAKVLGICLSRAKEGGDMTTKVSIFGSPVSKRAGQTSRRPFRIVVT